MAGNKTTTGLEMCRWNLNVIENGEPKKSLFKKSQFLNSYYTTAWDCCWWNEVMRQIGGQEILAHEFMKKNPTWYDIWRWSQDKLNEPLNKFVMAELNAAIN